jgi:Domain of unknown function (DUF4326)
MSDLIRNRSPKRLIRNTPYKGAYHVLIRVSGRINTYYVGERVTGARRVKVTGDLFHGRIPDGAVYVGRQAPGLRRSPYANPYPVKTYGLAESLLRYRLHIEGFDMATLERDLAGKDLACWCPLDQPCHAVVLLELANP